MTASDIFTSGDDRVSVGEAISAANVFKYDGMWLAWTYFLTALAKVGHFVQYNCFFGSSPHG